MKTIGHLIMYMYIKYGLNFLILNVYIKRLKEYTKIL